MNEQIIAHRVMTQILERIGKVYRVWVNPKGDIIIGVGKDDPRNKIIASVNEIKGINWVKTVWRDEEFIELYFKYDMETEK